MLDALGARYAVEVLTPTGVADATRLAREGVDAGVALVLAAGGDGTARAVAEGLLGTGVPLGVLPAGTANDLARALGLPGEAVAAARRIAAGAPRAVDVVDAGGHAFCTVGGLGLVARGGLAVPALKARGGVARAVASLAGAGIYKLAATFELLAHGAEAPPTSLSYLTPGGVRRDETVALHGLFIANQRFTGGGLALPSGSRDDDGVFELCLVLRSSRARLLDAFTRLTLGLPIPADVLRVVPVREAHLVTGVDDQLLGDGDRIGGGRVFHLRARPRALRVMV